METSRNRKIFIVPGVILLMASFAVFTGYLRSDWKIKIGGLQTISQREIESYVRFYLEQNPDHVVTGDIEDILKFQPRIAEVHVSVFLKTISVDITEKKPGYLQQNKNTISELSVNDKVIQESVSEKNHLSEDFPIFYLTASNQPEIETIRGDIIHLWEKTGKEYGFIWSRISEIEIAKNEMNDIIINLYHTYFPIKITLYDKMDINSLRKLWAIFYILDSQKEKDWKYARVYQDHAVFE